MSDRLSVGGREASHITEPDISSVNGQENRTVIISGIKVTALNNSVSVLRDCFDESDQAKTSFITPALFNRNYDLQPSGSFEQLLARVLSTIQIRARNDHKSLIGRYVGLINSVRKGTVTSIDQLKNFIGIRADCQITEEQNSAIGEVFLILSSESINFDDAQCSAMQNLAKQLHDEYENSIESFICAYSEAMSTDETEQFLRTGMRGFIFDDIFISPPEDEPGYSAGLKGSGNTSNDLSGLEIAGAFSWVCTSITSADDMLSYLEKKFDSASVYKAITVMMKTVSSGLCEAASFTDRDSLQVLGRNLSSLQHLKTAINDAGRFINAVQKIADSSEGMQLGSSAASESGVTGKDFILDAQKGAFPKKLVSRVVKTAMKGSITPKDVRNIVIEVNVMDCTSEVILAQSLMSFIRNLSEHIFSSLESRNRLIASAQEMIDMAIQEEDRYLASLELVE